MSNITIPITANEQGILNSIYWGEKNRDASSKIRGFIFQDLVAVQSLLDSTTAHIVSEFIEDVMIISSNGAVRWIQVKYNPDSSTDLKEIVTDFYYEYLQCELLGSNMNFTFELVVHSGKQISSPSLKQVKKWIPDKKDCKPTFPSNPQKWLRENIFEKLVKDTQGKLKTLDKKGRKAQLFKSFAYNASIEKFYDLFSIRIESDLDTYQSNIENLLASTFKPENFTPISNSSGYSKILLGLALELIQERYKCTAANFSKIVVSPDEFYNRIENILKTDTGRDIVGYLIALICEEYIEILALNPEMGKTQKSLLDTVCIKTREWISELGNTADGQFKIVNSLSRTNPEKLEGFTQWTEPQRRDAIVSCENDIKTFFDYLWKIVCNIYTEKFGLNTPIKSSELDPRKYIDQSEHDYICLHFPDDYVTKGVILPPVNSSKRNREFTYAFDRMKRCRPQKWYQCNDKRGEFSYKINPARINSSTSVADMTAEDVFYIECMDCIDIDEEGFYKSETCSTCIFKKDCIHKAPNNAKEDTVHA